MASLVFCKSICTFISGNSTGMRFYFMKEDVGLRVLRVGVLIA